MIYLAIMSAAAAAIQLSMGVIALSLSNAPGWRYYRLFTLISFFMALYASNNVLMVYEGDLTWLANASARLSFFLAATVGSLWLLFSRLRDEERLSRLDIGLLSLLVPLALLSLIPNLLLTGTTVTGLTGFGFNQRSPDVTFLGLVLYATTLFTMTVVASRFIRRARAGSAEHKFSAAGFSLFLVLALEETLVALGVVELPYLADLGFTGISIGFAVELTSRVASDGRALRTLNHDLEKLVDEKSRDLAETRDALLVAERHAAIGQLASGVGHEINNPLSYVSGNLTYLRDYQGPHEWDADEMEAIEEALDGAGRIERIVSDLTVFSGAPEEDKEVADVRRAILSALRIARPENRDDLEFSSSLVTTGNVEMDESKLTQVMVNLLVNAAHASIGPGPHQVSLTCFHAAGRQVIEVSDRGTGIEASSLERIFDPLYTTKEVGQGTGLGLYVCRGIIEDAGGSITVRSRLGQGTTFTVELPATGKACTAITTIPPRESPESAVLEEGLRIFIIDDEERITRAMQRMLREAEVRTENDGNSAQQHLLEGANYDVVICDLMMPTRTGMEIFAELKGAGSPLCDRFIFITGGAVTNEAEEFLERDDIRFLLKPVMPIALKTTINEVAALR